MSMNNNEIISLIQDCISNSESKLDSAQILGNNRKFADAISWIIIAYEEAGKADFLMSKLAFNETINDEEWNSLTRSGSHIKKLVMYYENRKKAFESMSESDFATLKSHYSKSFPISHTRSQIAEELELTINIFRKLNFLKKRLFYVDANSQSRSFSETELNSIFSLLDFETRKSISLTKFGVESYLFVPSGDDQKDLKELDKFDSLKKMTSLKQESQIPQNSQKFTLAKSLLQSL